MVGERPQATGEHYGRCWARCESPIERAFLVALLFLDRFTFRPLDRPPVIARDARGIELGQQVPIGPYRADFTLFRPGAAQRFVIELDGYKDHASTPAKHSADLERANEIVSLGWIPIRFSGSQINADASGCAKKAMAVVGRSVEGLPDVSDIVAPPPAPIIVPPPPTDPELIDLFAKMAAAEAAGNDSERTRLGARYILRTLELLEAKTPR